MSYKPGDVTAVMTTYANSDFTHAATWALRRFWPEMRIIYADGHPETPFKEARPYPWFHSDLVWIPEACTEDCRNAAVALVNTPFVLFQDNDVKVMSPDALTLCLETLDLGKGIAATGWYGLVVADWTQRRAFVGTDFTDHMDLVATQATFSLHRVEAYRSVGGMPKAPFWEAPEALYVGVKRPAYMGDFTVCSRYRAAGYRVVSPKRGLPILHWTQAVAWMGDKEQDALAAWIQANCTHTRCNPLNDWRSKV